MACGMVFRPSFVFGDALEARYDSFGFSKPHCRRARVFITPYFVQCSDIVIVNSCIALHVTIVVGFL